MQTFWNSNSTNRQTLEDLLVIFRRKYVKPESHATSKHKWHTLIFDPNTMKLPDFLEELNQGTEKTFGENAKSMIDSFLYAKLPPKLKQPVNMALLENGAYDDIVVHLERELELIALEESYDLPIATRASESTSSRNLLSNSIDSNKDAQCSYCKAAGHFNKNCTQLKTKKEMEDKMAKKPQRQTYPPCETCGKKITNQKDVCKALELIYVPRGLNKMKKPRMTQTMKENAKKLDNTETPTSGQSTSKKPESKNYLCLDSKYMTECQFHNTSNQNLQLSNFANLSKTQMASRLLSCSNR